MGSASGFGAAQAAPRPEREDDREGLSEADRRALVEIIGRAIEPSSD
jgi:hypothetical protein